MAFTTILCAVDFSDCSKLAAAKALELSDAVRGDVIFLYVSPTLARYGQFYIAPSTIEDFAKEVIEGARKQMEEFITELASGKEHVRGLVVMGYAPEKIIEIARESNADLIVMGTQGRQGFDRIIFGSVAEKIVKTSPVPVLTVRPHSPDQAD